MPFPRTGKWQRGQIFCQWHKSHVMKGKLYFLIRFLGVFPFLIFLLNCNSLLNMEQLYLTSDIIPHWKHLKKYSRYWQWKARSIFLPAFFPYILPCKSRHSMIKNFKFVSCIFILAGWVWKQEMFCNGCLTCLQQQRAFPEFFIPKNILFESSISWIKTLFILFQRWIHGLSVQMPFYWVGFKPPPYQSIHGQNSEKLLTETELVTDSQLVSEAACWKSS